MKSRRLENKDHNYETACKECLFATFDGKTQTGCTLGRIEKFQDLGKTDERSGLALLTIALIGNSYRNSGQGGVLETGKKMLFLSMLKSLVLCISYNKNLPWN